MLSILTLLLGIVAGGALSHVLERRRWHMEARKDAYVQFANFADQLATSANKTRRSAADGVRDKAFLYGPLHQGFRDLRPAYYELRLLAPPEIAQMAEDFYQESASFVLSVDPRGSGWGPEPAAEPEEYDDIHLAHAPSHEDVDAFVEVARADLVVNKRRWWPRWRG